MVLSNAERQKRYRERTKAMLATGVTPDDIRRAGRLIFDLAADGDPGLDWASWRARAATKKGGNNWRELLAGLRQDDADLYGDDADLMRRVAAVIEAVEQVPAE